MINWKVRIKNKSFWISLIPTVLILAQVVADALGFTFDFGALGNKLVTVIDAVFVLLSLLGIVVDPTTAGVSDSKLAMTYEEPRKSE